MADTPADIVDPYVKSRVQYFRKVAADGREAMALLREATRPPNNFPKDVYAAVAQIVQEFSNLAYGLDEAMAALHYYASADTWKEVPEHTLAAQDVGMKARVALARIDPV